MSYIPLPGNVRLHVVAAFPNQSKDNARFWWYEGLLKVRKYYWMRVGRTALGLSVPMQKGPR